LAAAAACKTVALRLKPGQNGRRIIERNMIGADLTVYGK
jgi:hypothetical protein